MLAVGEEIELDIDNFSHYGEGVGRWQGRAVFVPFTVPGERVRARVAEVKKNYCRATLVHVAGRSAGRAAALCDQFGKCGGCMMQHVDYARQLQAKREMVRESLARIGGLEGTPVKEVMGMTRPWHYRNKVQLQAENHLGELQLGFYEEGSHRLARTCEPFSPGCLLLDEDLNSLAAGVQEILNRYRVKAFDPQTGTGLLRHVVLRKGNSTGEMMAVLVTTPGDWPAQQRFAQDLADLFPALKSIQRHVTGTPAGDKTSVLKGEPFIRDQLGDLTFHLSAGSFYQVNSVQALELYRVAQKYAFVTPSATVVDAYSGVGAIALFMARAVGRVVGLEVVPGAVGDARLNAGLNGMQNVEFHLGAVEDLLPRLARRGLKADVIVLDPPRRGCHTRVLETIAAMEVPRVVYVSCDPGTMARDLGRLKALGYTVLEVQPVDMFPQTYHVETIALVRRGESRME